jgi:hypothetical protein
MSTLRFEDNSRLQTLERIGPFACPLLEAICIPDSVVKIADHCFAQQPIQCVTFESGCRVAELPIGGFSGSPLRSIVIPRSVRVIGQQCFDHCTALSTVDFQADSQLLTIGATAFGHCRSLASICVPRFVERILSGCFVGANSLSMVAFEPGSVLCEIDQEAFAGCPLKSLTIPSSVETIGSGCFRRCESLSAVEFEPGSRLSTIDGYVFTNCRSLKAICIPKSVGSLGMDCFSHCLLLSDVSFEPRVDLLHISSRAFADCPSLKMNVRDTALLYAEPRLRRMWTRGSDRSVSWRIGSSSVFPGYRTDHIVQDRHDDEFLSGWDFSLNLYMAVSVPNWAFP